MSRPKTSLKSTPDIFPVLSAVERFRGTAWSLAQGRLNDIANVACEPDTQKFDAGPISHPNWRAYPEISPGWRLRQPIWAEALACFLKPGEDPNDERGPVACLITPGERRTIVVQLVVLPQQKLPFSAPLQIRIDVSEADDGQLLLADFHRARAGLPLARDAATHELLCAEERVVEVDQSLYVRSRCGNHLGRRALGGPAVASNASPALAALRSAHERVVVESTARPEDALHENAVDAVRANAALRAHCIARGPFIAVSILASLAAAARGGRDG